MISVKNGKVLILTCDVPKDFLDTSRTDVSFGIVADPSDVIFNDKRLKSNDQIGYNTHAGISFSWSGKEYLILDKEDIYFLIPHSDATLNAIVVEKEVEVVDENERPRKRRSKKELLNG